MKLPHRSVIDPYGIMAMLGFLVFLFYLIYNYLNATGSANNGRKFLLFNSLYNSDAEEKIHLTNRIWNSLMMEINKKSLWNYMYLLVCFKDPKNLFIFSFPSDSSKKWLDNIFVCSIFFFHKVGGNLGCLHMYTGTQVEHNVLKRGKNFLFVFVEISWSLISRKKKLFSSF